MIEKSKKSRDAIEEKYGSVLSSSEPQKKTWLGKFRALFLAEPVTVHIAPPGPTAEQIADHERRVAEGQALRAKSKQSRIETRNKYPRR